MCDGRRRFSASVACALVLLAACASAPRPSDAAWAENYCAAVGDFLQFLRSEDASAEGVVVVLGRTVERLESQIASSNSEAYHSVVTRAYKEFAEKTRALVDQAGAGADFDVLDEQWEAASVELDAQIDREFRELPAETRAALDAVTFCGEAS